LKGFETGQERNNRLKRVEETREGPLQGSPRENPRPSDVSFQIFEIRAGTANSEGGKFGVANSGREERVEGKGVAWLGFRVGYIRRNRRDRGGKKWSREGG